MKLNATQFRVLNYRNIEDSGWIEHSGVRGTAHLGRTSDKK